MDAKQEEATRIAIIGAGMVAGIHLAAIADSSEALRLDGIYDRRSKNAETLLSSSSLPHLSDVRIYNRLDDIAASDEIDFALLITPPNARLEIVETLAKAGKPILMEKPVARNLEEAKQIVEICEKADVPLGVVFQHRFREASVAARALIDSDVLGSLYLAEITVPWWRSQSYYDEPGRGTYARDGGGVLISQAVHTMDLALSLTGPVASVQAMAATTAAHDMESEDFAVAGLRYTNGAVGSLVASTASYPGKSETIQLHFEKASILLDSGVLTITWRNGKSEQMGEVSATGGGADPMAFTHDWHKSVIEDFAQALCEDRSPAVTGRDALLVHQLIDAIEASAKSGKTVEVESDI